ncbi:6-bladed beta-propeller [Candidatus Palauibacter sp.]|uniref:6-bladed beta-propeller n=1 Tax=Candidatus Palauibacter sp. TaxID=3101350 RepID=UPI003AF2D4E4
MRTKTTTTRPRFLPPVLPLALLVACGDTGNRSATGAAGTLDGPDVIVNAVTEEVFTVGSATGNDWDTFGSVSSVHFDAQANLHIFDSQAAQILVVGPEGSLIRAVGGQGEGPGEFGDVIRVIVGRDGSYTVMGFMQIDLLEPDGEFVRRITLDPMTTGLVMADVALPDGRLVGHFRRLGDDDEQSGEGVPIHLFPLDATEPELLYTAWELPEEAEDETSFSRTSEGGILTRMAAGRAFEPRLDFDVLTDGRLALIDSIGYRVKLIGLDGGVTGAIERPIAPLPVTAAIMEAERDRYRDREARILESATRLNAQIEQEGVEERTFADEVPVLFGLKVDWNDRIWVDRRGPTGDDDGPTDIVAPDGDYIGTLPPEGLRTPDAFGPDGLLAYIERDEMDVPTVRVVRLVALEPEG